MDIEKKKVYVLTGKFDYERETGWGQQSPKAQGGADENENVTTTVEKVVEVHNHTDNTRVAGSDVNEVMQQ